MATNGTARQPRSKRRKDTLRYYNQSDWMRPTGLGAIIAAVVLFYFGWTYVSYILASLLMPGGLFLFFYASVRHTSDADVEKERETLLRDFDSSVSIVAPLPVRRIMTMRFCVSLPACLPTAGLPMATRGISAAQKAETLSPTVLSARICSSPATRCWSVHVRFPLRKWMPIPAPDTPTALCGFLLRIYAVPDWTRSASA